jgi:hypothetical protein
LLWHCDGGGSLCLIDTVKRFQNLKFKIHGKVHKARWRVECLCSELNYLSSNNELWKQKFDEEFGRGAKLGDATLKKGHVQRM